MRTAWLKRSARVLALAVYVGGLGIAPLADARLEAAAATGTAHVESQTRLDCPPAHDHDTCHWCGSLRATAQPASGVVHGPALDDAVRPPLDALPLFAVSAARSVRHSRAPPPAA